MRTTGSFQLWNFYIWIICIVNESNVATTKACFRICAFRLSALFTLFLLLRKSLPWLVTLTTLISWTMSWLYAASYHKSGFNFKNLKPEFDFFFRKKNNKKNFGASRPMFICGIIVRYQYDSALIGPKRIQNCLYTILWMICNKQKLWTLLKKSRIINREYMSFFVLRML